MKCCANSLKAIARKASGAMLATGFVAIQAVIGVGLFAWGASQYGFDKMLTVLCVGVLTAALEIKLQVFSQILAMEMALWKVIWRKKC